MDSLEKNGGKFESEALLLSHPIVVHILIITTTVFRCPVEQDSLPLGDSRPLMDRVEAYTVYIKNSIAFPAFGDGFRRNNIIPGPEPTIYHVEKNPLGQVRAFGLCLLESEVTKIWDVSPLFSLSVWTGSLDSRS